MGVTTVRQLGDHVGQAVTVYGWVQTTRVHGKVGFVVVRDGTGIVQCVLVQKQVAPATWETLQHLTQETSLSVTGEVRADARAPGGYELTLQKMRVIGPNNQCAIASWCQPWSKVSIPRPSRDCSNCQM